MFDMDRANGVPALIFPSATPLVSVSHLKSLE